MHKLFCSVLLFLLGLFAAGATRPKFSFNVRNFGATGNGTTKDTAAFQKALDTCAEPVLEPISCTDLRWEGFAVTHDGTWATHPTCCTNVVIRNLHIRNTRDGIDVDPCKSELHRA